MNRASKLLTFLLNNKKELLVVAIVLTILKVLSTVSLFFLPTKSVEHYEIKENGSYFMFNIPRAIGVSQEKIPPKRKKPQQKAKQLSLKDLTLKAVYAMENSDGFILILDKKKQSHIISKDETFQGYTLIKVETRKATFTKDDKEYILEIKEDAKTKAAASRVKAAKSNSPVKIKSLSKETAQTKDRVARSEIAKYKKNVNLIWKDIKIQPNYRGGKIEGFNINYVKKGSIFEELGLQAGDILVSGNGKELKSVKDAFSIYKQIDKIKVFKLGVIRNGTEKELEYEVY